MSNALNNTPATSIEAPVFTLDQNMIDAPNAVVIDLPAAVEPTEAEPKSDRPSILAKRGWRARRRANRH